MFKLLVLVLLGYIAYRLFKMNKTALPPKEGKQQGGKLYQDYTDYEELDR